MRNTIVLHSDVRGSASADLACVRRTVPPIMAGQVRARLRPAGPALPSKPRTRSQAIALHTTVTGKTFVGGAGAHGQSGV